MLLKAKKDKLIRKDDADKPHKQDFLIQDKKIIKKVIKDEAITDNEPTTRQLIGNLILRAAVGGIGSYMTISHKNFMGSAIALTTTSMWLTEDLNELKNRYIKIKQKEYKETPYEELRKKDIKSADDVKKYLHDQQYKIARHLVTKDALAEIMQFYAFDLVPDELIYQQYQSTHPPSAYLNVKDFLQKEKLTLLGSAAIGICAYPILNLFDKMIPAIGAHIWQYKNSNTSKEEKK